MAEEVVIDCAKNFFELTKQKIRDFNKAKSTINDPHKRTVVSYPVHKKIYQLALEERFVEKEKMYSTASGCSVFNIQTLTRLNDVFGAEHIIKVKPEGDILLVCTWAAVRSQSSTHDLNTGRLVIPLKSSPGINDDDFNNETFEVFVPCGGPDEETNEIPEGFSQIPLHDVIPGSSLINVVPLTKTISTKVEASDSYFSVPRGKIFDSDVISLSGKRFIVESSGPDAFKRGYDCVSIGNRNKFGVNINTRNIRYGKMPSIVGKLRTISKINLVFCDMVDFNFKNVNKNKHGLLHLSFKNACFNESGYLLHDIAIPPGDVQ